MQRGDTPDTSAAAAGDARKLPLAELRHKDLNLLVVLAALLESNSVSAAARRLDSSQPATSRVLERLRDQFGDPLLIKSALKMVPTRRAQELRPLLEQALRLIDSVYSRTAAYDPAQETGAYAIGMNDSLQALLVPSLLAELRRVAPRARVRLHPVPMPSGVSALASGQIDVMVAFYPVQFEQLRSELLFDAPFGCLCDAGNAAILDRPDAVTLAALPSLDLSQFGVVSRMMDRFFAAHGLQRQVATTLTSYLSVPDTIAGTDLYAMVPRFLTPVLCRHPGVRFVPIDDAALTLPVHLCWHNNVHAHPFVSLLRSMLVSAARQVAP
ncbi:LysR family transcriptional regulator [Cupriavidus sp. NPDC089707]|uniref:LysR family transcriptional regulator n=1 Tax=Cupriavidus sp. NPDC089707 TaxID=3363963 RepID=UPI00380E3109